MIHTRPFDQSRRTGITLALLLTLGACASPSRQTRLTSSRLQVDAAKRTEVVMTALSLLETHYQYGSARPSRGFDCSGLVKYVFDTAAQAPLPHNTLQIAQLSRPIPRSSLQPGDFVFFNTLGRSNSHMGIYLGDAAFINAPSTGGRVRIDSLDNPYYTRHFESARTVFVP
ncbi:C40 family peptidase [Alcaligenaceae bacterium CGII-47]|nr:C40 family peptidase [Alcaligenaceae bacterium CGII-47]